MGRQCAVPLLLALSLTLAASAAPAITSISPRNGFTFGPTVVEITGTELASGHHLCGPALEMYCEVQVFFGAQQGTVLEALPERITALAPANPAEGRVDVRVRLQNGAELALPNAFVYARTPVEPSRRNYRAYLVPLRTGELRGANGSLWRTELTVLNGSGHLLQLLANNCDLPLRTPFCGHSYIDVAPDTPARLDLAPGDLSLEGTFLYLPEPLAPAVDVKLRVRDVSREAEGWGTEVPVVPLSAWAPVVRLLDVPNDPRYRAMLRMYGDHFDARTVRVTVYPMSGGTPIEERRVELRDARSPYNSDPGFPFVASYARLDPLSETVRASGHDRVRIDVVFEPPPRADPPIAANVWAFVSITNNVTQEVTTITPHVK